ncbi:Fe2+-dependent dioxygenase [Dyella sp. 2RAB6]|uniref:Fe2+-dependent dioxygenase n=1 Tax=Dyella sp. 2RAB6 TaxID=3232992 RepID=UPI003F90C62B
MLLHIPNVLSPDQLLHVRAELDRADWTDGRQTVGAQGAQVKRNLQLPETSPVREALGRLILDALAHHPLYHAAALPLRALAPRFNRYEGGGHYGYHVDGAVMALPGGGQLRSDLSCTLFLAEPDEYDGGELVVNDTYGEHEAKLPAGDLLLYPSSSLHEVRPVTRGARLAAFFWIQSLVRHEEQRRLLFDLDVAIQSLTAKPDTDRSTLLSLTGVYHNLLRQWSET